MSNRTTVAEWVQDAKIEDADRIEAGPGDVHRRRLSLTAAAGGKYTLYLERYIHTADGCQRFRVFQDTKHFRLPTCGRATKGNNERMLRALQASGGINLNDHVANILQFCAWPDLQVAVQHLQQTAVAHLDHASLAAAGAR